MHRQHLPNNQSLKGNNVKYCKIKNNKAQKRNTLARSNQHCLDNAKTIVINCKLKVFAKKGFRGCLEDFSMENL